MCTLLRCVHRNGMYMSMVCTFYGVYIVMVVTYVLYLVGPGRPAAFCIPARGECDGPPSRYPQGSHTLQIWRHLQRLYLI